MRQMSGLNEKEQGQKNPGGAGWEGHEARKMFPEARVWGITYRHDLESPKISGRKEEKKTPTQIAWVLAR